MSWHEPVKSYGEATGMCGCGRMLYAVLHDGVRVGVTHPNPDDDDHHLGFWREATPADVVGEENARKLGLE